ncbi:MAG TPA: hypothetical protein VIM65_18210 [Cyclobacteriaceae bacterium]
MTQDEALEYKRQFSLTLKPVMEMLEHKRNQMNSEDWAIHVIHVEASIINNPDQYIGRELPNINVVDRIIREIFEDFLQDQPNFC